MILDAILYKKVCGKPKIFFFILGVACGMPYNVTLEEALKHEEVKSRLASSITKLKQVTTMFLATIVKARTKVPYGIS